MLRRLIAILSLTAASYAGTPRPLSDIPIPAPGGKTLKLSQYRGKVMVVVLVLTTCQSCGQSAEMLQRVQGDYGDKIQAVVIAANAEAPQQIANFRDSHHLTYPVGYLTDEPTLMKFLDIRRQDFPLAPIFLFVNKAGTVVQQYMKKEDNFFKNEEKNTRTLVDGYLKQ